MFETVVLAASTVTASQTHEAAFEHGAIALVGAVSRHGGAIARLALVMASLVASPRSPTPWRQVALWGCCAYFGRWLGRVAAWPWIFGQDGCIRKYCSSCCS